VSEGTGTLTLGEETAQRKGLFYVPYLDDRPDAGSSCVGFARPEWVELAAALLDSPDPLCDPSPGGVVARYRLMLGPGVVRVGASVTGDERERGHQGRGRIKEWSARSRLRMVETMCSLDWGPVVEPGSGRRPAMVTLTLPGDWRSVAPTRAAFSKIVERFRKRWERAHGPMRAVWKIEFQRRGAPHLHLYLAVPCGSMFREWLSLAWTCSIYRLRVVRREGESWDALVERVEGLHGKGVRDSLVAGTGVDWGEGIRASDPKRLAVYFLKRATGHNLGRDKEYQHRVPIEWGGMDWETGEVLHDGGGPGRFWGYWGLERIVVERELDAEQFVQWRRLLRRWARSKGRPVRSLHSGRRAGGMVLVNDAPGLLAQAARWDALSAGSE
jgi:hypothetical protein